jgi:hypothetical protein
MLNTLLLHLRMVRLVAVAALLFWAGCMGEIVNGAGGDGGTQSPEEIAAKNAFEQEALPILNGFCASCHSGSMVGIDWMANDPDVRTHMLTFPGLINLDTPTQSQLLSKGAHEGPALTTDQAASLLDWINLEKAAAGGPDTSVETTAFQPVVGQNTVDLSAIGLTGSTLTFRLEPLSVGIYLNEITVHAGTDGAHVVHPLFVTWDDAGTASPDPVDRFSDIDLTVAAGTDSPLGGGTAVFVDVSPQTKLSIHFKVAELATGGDTTGGGGITGGGCKDVAGFTQYAQPLLAANCASCHAGNDASATAATDMTKINDLTDTGQAAACGQILSRVDKGSVINSGVFVAPNPGQNTTHPFKFGGDVNQFNNFQSQLTLWINQEIAP